MNPLTGELNNPFRAGKIIGANIDSAVYHRENTARGKPDLVMGRSALMEVLTNPHRWVKGYESKETDATERGTLMDCKVLTPGEFTRRYAIKPAKYPAEGGVMKDWHGGANWCKQWLADHAGQEHVSSADNAEADLAVKALEEDAVAGPFLKCCQRQVMVMAEYHDEETKLVIPVKILIDLLPDKAHPEFGKVIADYKTCRNAAPFAWAGAVSQFGYHVQAAFYLDVYSSVQPEERDQFNHLIQETVHPWEVGRRFMPEEGLERGRYRYREALALYCECLAKNEWPGYERPYDGAVLVRGWLCTEIKLKPWL